MYGMIHVVVVAHGDEPHPAFVAASERKTIPDYVSFSFNNRSTYPSDVIVDKRGGGDRRHAYDVVEAMERGVFLMRYFG